MPLPAPLKTLQQSPFAGAWLGARAYRRLSDQRFHGVVLGLLGLSGIALVWTSFT